MSALMDMLVIKPSLNSIFCVGDNEEFYFKNFNSSVHFKICNNKLQYKIPHGCWNEVEQEDIKQLIKYKNNVFVFTDLNKSYIPHDQQQYAYYKKRQFLHPRPMTFMDGILEYGYREALAKKRNTTVEEMDIDIAHRLHGGKTLEEEYADSIREGQILRMRWAINDD